jgi:hypothetical protein
MEVRACVRGLDWDWSGGVCMEYSRIGAHCLIDRSIGRLGWGDVCVDGKGVDQSIDRTRDHKVGSIDGWKVVVG